MIDFRYAAANIGKTERLGVRAVRSKSGASQIDVQVLGLGRPGGRKGNLNPGACRPARQNGILARTCKNRCDMAGVTSVVSRSLTPPYAKPPVT